MPVGGGSCRPQCAMTSDDAPHSLETRLRFVAWVLLGCAVLGGIVGVVWGLIAPRTQLTVREGELFYASVREDAVGGVLSLACLLLACAVATAVFVLARRTQITEVLLVGVAAAGFVGSVLAWRVGLLVANGVDGIGELSAQGRPEGVTFSAPLQMDAPGVLGIWSFVSVFVLAFVVWLRARRSRRRLHAIIDQANAIQSTALKGL